VNRATLLKIQYCQDKFRGDFLFCGMVTPRSRIGIGFGASVAVLGQDGDRGGVLRRRRSGWFADDRRVRDSPSRGLTAHDFGKDNA
jgi:hypothetical protein